MPRRVLRFVAAALRLALSGTAAYWAWMTSLLLIVAWGVLAYVAQLREGLALTAMRDSVSWGFYVQNFTFLVGVTGSPSSSGSSVFGRMRNAFTCSTRASAALALSISSRMSF